MKLPILIACLLAAVSIYVATLEFKVQTGQGCHVGDIENFNQIESDTIKRVNWFWQWWPERSTGYFVACIGPRTYLVYRPLDVAALGIGVSLAFVGLAARRTGKLSTKQSGQLKT